MPSFSTRTLYQEYNYVVYISVSKNVAVQALFKGRKILGFVWYITFPYPYFSISNHVILSYMTSITDIHSYNNSYLLLLWLLPHNQINMTCYYVNVCIQNLRRFDNYYRSLAFTTPSGIFFLLKHLNNTILCIIRIRSGEILT
jgi:hypothetical protein